MDDELLKVALIIMDIAIAFGIVLVLYIAIRFLVNILNHGKML